MVLVIAGPTASGKSALALAAADHGGGVIINADASQLYADLPILSAQPSAADRAVALHRLYGIRDGAHPASAAWWADAARTEVETAWGEGRLPILVGGTGLYLRALLRGIADVPAIDPNVRAAVRALDPDEARAALAREDPAAHVTDRQRVARALEVVRSTGRPLRAWQAETRGALAAEVRGVVVDPPPALLATRIADRFQAMLDAGAPGEAARLRARALSPDLPVMKALGLRPLLAHLDGVLTLAQAREAAAIETRQYAKRQRTWFRNQHAEWTRVTVDSNNVAETPIDTIISMLP